MPRISLTEFVDIVVRSGIPKMNKLSTIKNRPPYEPAYDFYKIIREALEDTHKNVYNKAHLRQILGTLRDPKKQVNYPEIVAGYCKWWGRKSFAWFDPPNSIFSNAGVDVSINPELGLEFGGKRYVVKLYFKGDTLAKNRIAPVTQLMENCLRPTVPPDVLMAVLDTRASRLFIGGELNPRLIAALKAELRYIAELWAQF